jgi:hypothetical protein
LLPWIKELTRAAEKAYSGVWTSKPRAKEIHISNQGKSSADGRGSRASFARQEMVADRADRQVV